MSPIHFRYAMLQRLRVPLFGDRALCKSIDESKRSSVIDKLGFHSLGCPRGGATHWRHAAVQRVVYEEAKAGLLNPRLDPTHIVESSKRPADIYVPDWSNRIPLAMDVSIVVPTRTTPSSSAGIAELAHQAKISKHREDCRKAGIRFEPIIFEAGGFIHPNAAKILEDLSCRRAIREGKEPKAVHNRLLHKISVCIQIGNAKAIAGDVDFDPVGGE